MTRFSHLIVFFLALCGLAAAQSASVVYEKTIQVQVPGATAAYSLDPLNAEASASNGVVTIVGKGPGSATVMVVTPDGVRTLPVTILQPPPSYPPGFVPPTLLSDYGESGTYEFRYSSDPSQWQNNLDLIWRNGSRRTQLRINNANLLSPTSGAHAISFPTVSYSYSSPARTFVVLDDEVNNSSLTVSNALVRGFHYKQGPWQFHAGITSQTSFREFLLSSNAEEVAGVSRTFRVTSRSEIIPNFYYFRSLSVNSPGHEGPVGSLVYRFKASEEFQYQLEVGLSRGVGGAGELRYSNASNQLHAEFRYAPQRFAGLGINQLQGQSAQADYSHTFTDRLSANVLFSRWQYELPDGTSASMTSSGLFRYAMTRHWIANAGVSASRFTLDMTRNTESTIALPVGLDFASARFGAGVSYQQQVGPSQFANNERQLRANARVSLAGVQVSGFVSEQTNAPTLQTVVADNSPLAEAVGTQSALASTPDSVASGLHDNLILAGLGYVKAVGVTMASKRMQYGASVNWIARGAGHDQLSYNFLADNDTLPTGRSQYFSHSIVYTRRITENNDVSVALSLVSLAAGGRAAYHPRFQVDARHRFSSLPTFFAPGSHGLISGRVFQDDAARGEYADDADGVADVEVVLDNQRRTRTDANGSYSFDHVPAGTHRVDAIPHTTAPFYFTTSSAQTAEINSRVNFGLGFSAGQVFGYIRNDALQPVGGVSVHVRNASGDIILTSDDSGRFERRGLPPGTYDVSVDPMSIPVGYSFAGLKQGTISVTAGAASEWDVDIKAIRSIAGKIVAYDRTKGQEVGVAGAIVSLRELPCAVITDKNGLYRFKELPPGSYTISVVFNGKEHTASVTLTDSPEQVRDANINVGAK